MAVILYSLLSYIGWGSGDIFAAIGSRKIGGAAFAFWSYIAGLVLSGLYIPFALGYLANLTPGILILNLFLGFLLLIAWFTFNQAFETGNPSLVGTISASFAPFVVVFSTLFLGEVISPRQIFAIVIIFAGLILSVIDFKIVLKRSSYNKGVVFALITMLLWGIYFTFIKIPIKQIGWYWPSMISLSVGPLSLIYLMLRKINPGNPFKSRAMTALVGSTVLSSVGTFSFNLAIDKGLSSIVAPIAGSYPTLFVVLAFLIFKDKIIKQQIIGIITTLLGIVLLSVFSA